MYVIGRVFTTTLFCSFTTLIFLSASATCYFAAVVLHTMVGSNSFTFSNSPSIITVRYVMMDGGFEKVKELLPTIVCNKTASKEHAAEAERKIRVVKEQNRGVVNTLTFTYIPRRMKIEFIYFVTLWLNTFLAKSGVSETFSPREILLRRRMDVKKNYRVLLGSYCEVHDKANPSNTAVSHTNEGIALGPTINLQGSVKFYCLNTGQVLKRRAFTEIPMPTADIAKVNKICKKENQGK